MQATHIVRYAIHIYENVTRIHIYTCEVVASFDIAEKCDTRGSSGACILSGRCPQN